MPNQTTESQPTSDASAVRAAIDVLRSGVNPFALNVAAVDTAEQASSATRALVADQLSDLLAIINQYRVGPKPTQTYPVVGQRGCGKTHLLQLLKNTLTRSSVEAGEETLVVSIDRVSPKVDAIDGLKWSIANYLIQGKDDGDRLLTVIAERLTSRLLAEALRRVAPPERIALIPANGLWGRLGFGENSAAKRLSALDELMLKCDAVNPAPGQLRAACEEARLKVETALAQIKKHLDITESQNSAGWFRSQLYQRLARIALLRDRALFEELHTDDFDSIEKPANVSNDSARLLQVWLELLPQLAIPVVVTFDQLEDFLLPPDPEERQQVRKAFTAALGSFVDKLSRVAVLVFAEEGLWQEVVLYADGYAQQRITQPFTVPGKAAKQRILMPDHVDADLIQRLIQERVKTHCPTLNLTGLPATFPFSEQDTKQISESDRSNSIRGCLVQLALRYDQIVNPPRVDLKKRLELLWKEQFSQIKKRIGSEMYFSTSFIPEVQTAVQSLLDMLIAIKLVGQDGGFRTELINETKKNQFGYLNVIRDAGTDQPGIGIAAWLGEGPAKPTDLKHRISFFQLNPCPIRTLVLLRSDGEEALHGGVTGEHYQAVVNAGHDLRVQKYKAKQLHALMAFGPWYQAAINDVETAQQSDAEAPAIFKEFVAGLTKEWCEWIEEWRQPPA